MDTSYKLVYNNSEQGEQFQNNMISSLQKIEVPMLHEIWNW